MLAVVFFTAVFFTAVAFFATVFFTAVAFLATVVTVVAGGAGESLYKFGSPDSYQGDVSNDASISSYVNEASGEVAETVTWSEVRYTGYNLLVVDAAPASFPGGTAKLAVRGLNEDGQELDNFTLARKSRLF